MYSGSCSVSYCLLNSSFFHIYIDIGTNFILYQESHPKETKIITWINIHLLKTFTYLHNTSFISTGSPGLIFSSIYFSRTNPQSTKVWNMAFSLPEVNVGVSLALRFLHLEPLRENKWQPIRTSPLVNHRT